MLEASLPVFSVVITPNFDVDKSVASLDISLTIERCKCEKGNPIVEFRHKSEKVHIEVHEQYADTQIALQAVEGKSHFLMAENTIGEKFWINYRVSPSLLSGANESAALDLHFGKDGMLGSGMGFIPLPSGTNIYRNILTWDLSRAPEGTRAVWTYGEGPQSIEKIGPASILCGSVYMVGQIKSYPPVPVGDSISDHYGYYWYGSLPPNIEVIQKIHFEFVMKIAGFFEDSFTKESPYRSFVRNLGSVGSLAGTSFTRSHIFDYDNRIEEVEDYDLVRQMSYEMSHNWLGPNIKSKEIDWFYEGLKNCLSVYFPFRNKFRTGHYFQATISMLCTQYYTNPLIDLPHAEVVKLAATDEYAKELLSSRAWAFAVGTDLRARRMSELVRPVEDLAIKPLSKRRSEGKSHGVEDWLAFLKPLMGTEAQERYDEMLSGRTILLDPRLFGAKTHYLKQVDQEVLDFGMDRCSFKNGVVQGLKEGSRAEEAGLKEGDVVLRNSYEWRCVDHFEERMDLVVLRDKGEVKISYWPRSYIMAPSWQMVKKEDEES